MGTVVWLSAQPEEERWWRAHTAVSSYLPAAVSTVVHLTQSQNHQGTDNPVSAERESYLFVIKWDGVTSAGSQ